MPILTATVRAHAGCSGKVMLFEAFFLHGLLGQRVTSAEKELPQVSPYSWSSPVASRYSGSDSLGQQRALCQLRLVPN
jgi:hypothetical protein